MKRRSNKPSKKQQRKQMSDDSTEDVGETLTLVKENTKNVDANEQEDDDEWDAEAKALRQAISEGAFGHLSKDIRGIVAEEGDSEDEEEDENEDEEESEDSDDEDEDTGDDEPMPQKKATSSSQNVKALVSITEELMSTKKNMPWVETFDVIPSDPLPFNDGNKLDVHDDLKREVAFYNMALDAVNSARNKCRDIDGGLPFERPQDFFAEMVKTDNHMAKVKDRLIFETKKMDAFAQRKANREHKLHAKEAHAHKLAERAKDKKEHFKAVDGWAKSAASKRGSGRLDDDDDDAYFGQMRNNKRGRGDSGPTKKRMAADKKYGFGGKRGRFKQNDRKSLNDMSSFNPRGNFAGGSKGRPAGGGAKRKGKRARDAARARS